MKGARTEAPVPGVRWAPAPPANASPISLWLAFLIFVVIGRATELIPGFASLPLAKLMLVGATIAALVNRERLSAHGLLQIPGTRTAYALFALAIFSVVFSVYRGASFNGINGVFLLMITFGLIVKSAKGLADVERILKALVWSGAALSFATLLGYQGGRAEIKSSYDTNDLAYVLVSILPIAVVLGVVADGLRRLLWRALSVVALVTIALTQSRGGMVALVAIGALAALVPQFHLAREDPEKPRRRNLVLRLLMVAAVGACIWLVLPAETQQRMATMLNLGSDYNTDLSNKEGRFSVWERNAGAAIQRPFGYGLNTFSYVDNMYGGTYKAPHNSLLQVWVELGFLGLFLYLHNYWTQFRELGRIAAPAPATGPPALPLARSPQVILLYSRALRLSLIGNFVAGFFLSQAYSNLHWILIATCAALIAVVRPAPKGP